MRTKDFMALMYIVVTYYYVTTLPFVACLTSEDVKRHKSLRENNHKLNSKKISDVTIHGVLLWISMGLLMPLGVLTIRISLHKEGGRKKLLFYLHLILQMLAVLLATAGAIMSIRSFENSFDNNHQRIGLALYIAIWIQAGIGFIRPRRGHKKRSTWYFVHWLLGTITSLTAIINIYTGLNAYKQKLSRSTRLFTILFTAQVSFMAFLYLFQDKWDYMQKQGLILGTNNINNVDTQHINNNQVNNIEAQSDNINVQKVLVPQPCTKRNALKYLFDQ